MLPGRESLPKRVTEVRPSDLMITYQPSGDLKQNLWVYLDGKRIGTIKPTMTGFAYYPAGSRTQGITGPTPKDIQDELEEM